MGTNEEVMVSYIAITEHTSLWEISGAIKYGNLQMSTNLPAHIQAIDPKQDWVRASRGRYC
jgi:hypothetical protein